MMHPMILDNQCYQTILGNQSNLSIQYHQAILGNQICLDYLHYLEIQYYLGNLLSLGSQLLQKLQK